MTMSHPLMHRTIVAKTTGFVFGLIAFFLLPLLMEAPDLMFRFGLLAFYLTLGGLVAIVGVFDRHPAFPGLGLPWWIRGTLMGGWLALLVILFAYEPLALIISSVLGGAFSSPWWLLLEGAIAGALIDFIATRLAGEGEDLLHA